MQDEGSQLLGLLVAPRRTDMVVDFCAGAGGKTMLLGALMRSQGRVYAFDVSRARLARFKPRLARSGLSNVQPALIENERDTHIKRLAGKIDRVLVDAPCSGFGTLRRNPDLKWRQTAEAIAELAIKQARILAAAATLVKPGGRLVYATCSVLPEENEAIVEAFSRAHPEFALGDAAAELRRAGIALDTGPLLKLSTARHGCDGFFAAVLERSMRAATAAAGALAIVAARGGRERPRRSAAGAGARFAATGSIEPAFTPGDRIDNLIIAAIAARSTKCWSTPTRSRIAASPRAGRGAQARRRGAGDRRQPAGRARCRRTCSRSSSKGGVDVWLDGNFPGRAQQGHHRRRRRATRRRSPAATTSPSPRSGTTRKTS